MSALPYAEVIGDPIAQSKSPIIHGFWAKKLGLQVEYRHKHVKSEGLASYLAERRLDPHWRGCNVTMPHKQAVMAHLDAVDPLAAKVGAVNTIIRGEDGTLRGTNTDVDGFLEPLADELKKAHLFRMARIIGTGGAARAVLTALGGHGFTCVVIGRNEGKARALVDELLPEGEHYTAPLAHFANPTDFAFDDRERIFDLVVNASALGMAGEAELAYNHSHTPPGATVYDIVTSPRRTPLLESAAAAGFPTIEGITMLIGQARLAFRHFFGQLPDKADDAELLALLMGAAK